MTLETSWTRENMSSKNSPNHKCDLLGQKRNNRRLLIEAELVQRTVEKLSNSAWDSNSSKSPKILMNQSPIIARSPLRKNETYRTKNASSSPILNGRKASGTAFTNKTPKVNSTPKDESTGKVSEKYTPSVLKKSPPRKIENTNIVFTPSPKSKTEINYQSNKKDKLLSKINNSFHKSNYDKSESEKPRAKVNKLDKSPKSSVDQSLNSINEWKKNSPARLRNNKQSKTSASLSSATFTRAIPKITSKPFECSPDSSSSTANDNKSPAKRLSKPLLSSRTLEKIYDSKINSPDNLHSRYLPCAINSKSPMKLTPIDENIEINSKPRPSSSDAFMTTTKKSTALEQIVKKKMVGNNGLIQDIIQELQKKCETKSNSQDSTFSQGSKRFVKKLVKVLEDSIDTEKEEKLKEEYINVNKKNYCNHLNKNSVASSAAKSFKDSGSSKSPSPTLSSSPNYNWTVKTQMDIKNRKNNPSCNDANIKWIPLPTNLGMPRTSSAFSMKSSRSSSRSSNKSLSVSPVTEDNENEHFFNNDEDNWTWSCEKNSSARRSFGMKKSNGIFDSGYSEFDNINHSLMIQRFLAEYRASQSLSEFDTSANRRFSFSGASSVFTRSLQV